MVRVLLCLMLVGTAMVLLAQTTSIKIIDSESGQPLVGACISIIDLGLGDCTDEFGVIQLPEKVVLPATVSASYIGYFFSRVIDIQWR